MTTLMRFATVAVLFAAVQLSTVRSVCNSAYQYTCKNGWCILKFNECDGRMDCLDNSDEAHCTNAKCYTYFQCDNRLCVSGSKECDGRTDCSDGSDEKFCGPNARCGTNEIACNDGRCILKSRKCDGYKHCRDGSDEINCPPTQAYCPHYKFSCFNGECIRDALKCNGNDDCGDGSDEDERYCEDNMALSLGLGIPLSVLAFATIMVVTVVLTCYCQRRSARRDRNRSVRRGHSELQALERGVVTARNTSQVHRTSPLHNNTSQPHSDTSQPPTDTSQPHSNTSQPPTDTSQPHSNTSQETQSHKTSQDTPEVSSSTPSELRQEPPPDYASVIDAAKQEKEVEADAPPAYPGIGFNCTPQQYPRPQQSSYPTEQPGYPPQQDLSAYPPE